MKRSIALWFLLICIGGSIIGQETLTEYPPLLKGYQDNPGKVFKNHYFNYITLKDESGENERQSTGLFWEISYVYDSVFRQKEKFHEFMVNHVKDLGGVLFFQDTSSLHFAIVREGRKNIWGRAQFSSDKSYRLKIIEERPFDNKLSFDESFVPQYDDLVEPVNMPPRIGILPSSVINRARYSKFNHFRITYVSESRESFEQKLMGPFWDLKLSVINEEGAVDKRVSTIEIMESYYRAVRQAGGTILKSRPREMIFYLPIQDQDKKLWVRLMTSLDGVYYLRMILQANEDETPPTPAAKKVLKDTTK